MENILNAPTASDDAFDQYVQYLETLRYLAGQYDFCPSTPIWPLGSPRSFKEILELHCNRIVAEHYAEPKLTMTFDDLLNYGEYDA